MDPELRALIQRRQAIFEEARNIFSRAEERGQALQGAEEAEWAERMEQVRALDVQIRDMREALEARERLGDLGDGQRTAWLPSTSEYRSLAEGTDTSGGYLVPAHHAASFWQDRMRPQSVFLQAGPLVIETDSDEVHLPRIGQSAAAAWTAEGGLITASQAVLARLTLKPKKLAALTYASSEVMADSRPSVRELVQYDLERELGSMLDQGALAGTGATEATPTGLRFADGVNVTELGSGDGAAATLDDLAAALARVEANNAAPNAVFMRPAIFAALRGLKDGQNRPLMQPDVTATAQRSLFGVPVFVSNNLPTETVGTADGASSIIVADMRHVVFARRQDVEVKLSESARFEFDEVGIRAILRADVGVSNVGAVEVISGVLAA